MSKERHEAAKEIARHLFAAEDAADHAFRSAAILAAALPTARVNARMSAIAGHRAFTAVAKALDLQAQTRAALVEAHEHFAELAEDLNIPARVITGYGTGPYKPTGHANLPAVASLHAVA